MFALYLNLLKIYLAQYTTDIIISFFKILNTAVSKRSPVPPVMYDNEPQVKSLAEVYQVICLSLTPVF